MNSLEQIQIGFDEAKQKVYKSMLKVYPNVDKSTSGLVNALVSGFSYLYSSYQVFAKAMQSEAYVSTAQDIESLYKLVPMVGINTSQPVPMHIVNSAEFQDTLVTGNYYLSGENLFNDNDGNPFLLGERNNVKTVAYRFNDPTEDYWATGSTAKRLNVFDYAIADDSRVLALSIGKLLGDEYVPISLYEGDYFTIEVPYLKGGVIVTVTFSVTRTGTITLVSGSSSDLVLGGCKVHSLIGLVIVTLAAGCSFLSSTDSNDSLVNQPVNITYTIRSRVQNSIEQSALAASDYSDIGYFTKANLAKYCSKYLDTSDTTGLCIGSIDKDSNGDLYSSIIIQNNYLPYVLPSGDRYAVLSLSDYVSNAYAVVDYTTLKIEHNSIADLKFDFENATTVYDNIFGTVYKTTCAYTRQVVNASNVEVSLTSTFNAYLIDKYLGLIIVDLGWQSDGDLLTPANELNVVADFEISYTDTKNSKVILDQKELSTVTVDVDDVSNDTMDYILEDDDYILFNNINITALIGTVASDPQFIQVDNIDTVENTALINYFEITVLSNNKIKIRFKDDSYDFKTTSVDSLIIDYYTVKDITSYSANTELSGYGQLFDEDGNEHEINGNSTYYFDLINLIPSAGVGGILGLEDLRTTLQKASYTYDKYTNVTNYEYAIKNYFASKGFSSLVKVFDYNDFGIAFVNYCKGNIVYYIGIVNRYLNSDLIIVAHTGMTPAWYGDDDSVELSEADFSNLLFSGFTCISRNSNALINTISNSDSENIRLDLLNDSALTNYMLSQEDWILSWSVFFKFKLKPASGYTYAKAEAACIKKISSYFTWNSTKFARDLNVSDVYNDLDNLPEVDKLLLTNMSHYKNSDIVNHKVDDISYRTITAPSVINDELIGSGAGNASQVYNLQLAYFGLDTTVGLSTMFKGYCNAIVTLSGISYDIECYLIPYGALTGGAYKLYVSSNGTTIPAISITNDYAVGLIYPATGEVVLDVTASSQLNDWKNAIRACVSMNSRVLNSGSAYTSMNVTAIYMNGLVLGSAILADYTWDVSSARADNPLFNYSGVYNNGNTIYIDILALGGIESQPY